MDCGLKTFRVLSPRLRSCPSPPLSLPHLISPHSAGLSYRGCPSFHLLGAKAGQNCPIWCSRKRGEYWQLICQSIAWASRFRSSCSVQQLPELRFTFSLPFHLSTLSLFSRASPCALMPIMSKCDRNGYHNCSYMRRLLDDIWVTS